MKQAFLTLTLLLLIAGKMTAQQALQFKPDHPKPIPFGQRLPPPQGMPDRNRHSSRDLYPTFDSSQGVTGLKMPGREIKRNDLTKAAKKMARPVQQGRHSTTLANFRLTKDLNARSESDPQNYSSNRYPSEFAVLNDVSYFHADDGIHGLELWRSDATAAGTYLVKDVNPGEASGGREGNITVAGNKLYFPGTTENTGIEPWVSDGTEAGTFEIANIGPGSENSFPTQFVAVGTEVFFIANFTQLWKTDGTKQGTAMIKDLYQSNYTYQVFQATEAAGLLFFTAYDIFSGFQLWKSDGTTEGTFVVKQLGYFLSEYQAPNQLTAYDGKLFFSVDDGTGRRLWISDGTYEGTGYAPGFNEVFMTADYLNIATANPFKIINNMLYIAGFTWQDGSGLYKYDATNDAGIVLVKDLTPGFETMFITPVDFAVVNDRLYFKVISAVGSFHDELWKSDGDAVSTEMIKTFEPGEITFDHNNGNGLLFFNVVHGVYGNELWTSDGTLSGTALVKDIWPGAVSAAPYYYTEVNGKVLFNGADPVNGASLYVSDGTAAGTVVLKDINNITTTGSNPGGSVETDIGVVKNGIVFSASEREFGNELYTSDGTKAGTFLVKDLVPGEVSSYPNNFLPKNGGSYFRVNNTDQSFGFPGSTIYFTNGTTLGTKKIVDANQGYFMSYDVSENGLVFFTMYNLNSFRYELWRSNGSAAGTFLLYDGVNYDTYVVTVGNTAYFSAGDNDHGFELWKSDGSLSGTRLVKDIFPGWEGSGPNGLFVHQKEVYFSAVDGPDYLRSIWKSDGTSRGTIKLKNVSLPVIGSSVTANIFYCSAGKELYFMAFDFQNWSIGSELFVTKGKPSNTVLVKNINPNADAYPNNMTNVNGTVYFLALDDEHGMELWSTRGTSESTKLVKDLTPGPEWSDLYELTNIDGKLHFIRNAGSPAASLWATDGTEKGTQPVESEGLGNLSALSHMEPAGDHLFISAYTYKYGQEMFVADILKHSHPLFSKASPAAVKSSTGFEPVLFPNPADDLSSVRIPVTVKNVVVTLADISGKIIWRKNATNTNKVDLPVDNLAAGVYLVNISSGKECRIIKLVKN